MKKTVWQRGAGAIVLLMAVCLLFLIVPSSAITVTMYVNTSTNLDTLQTSHIVQMRGEYVGSVTPKVTWNDDSGIFLTNIGGDYWKAVFQMTPGTTMKYKFWTGYTKTKATFFWNGWEGPINPKDAVSSGDNRYFVAGSNDTTVAVQFYNGTATKQNQYWRPYAAKPDTFAVYLRVDMGNLLESGDFDPKLGHTVVVRGSAPLDPTDTWNTELLLKKEESSADNGAFYAGTGYVPKSVFKAGTVQKFKFVVKKGSTAVWESTSDRTFTYKTANDTTIHWAYFNNLKPTGQTVVQATLTWQIKVDALEKLGLFNRSLGEKIVIDGAKAWDIANPIEMTYVPLLGSWVAQEPFKKVPGAVLEYKAVVFWDSTRVDPASPNYTPGLDLTVPIHFWEEPNVTGTGNRNYTYTDKTEQMVPGDWGFEHQFFCGLPVEGVITTPITITFNINMTPAASLTTNPANPLFRPGVDTVWVQLDGAMMSLTQGQGLYANTPLMLTDLDGDLVYSGSWALKAPTTYDVAYRINYSSSAGSIIQNGGGFQKGRSYIQFIHPNKVNADGSIVWPDQFSFPVVAWKDTDLPAETSPNLWTPTRVASEPGAALRSFALMQNYPNPFNPATAIDYRVAEKSHVLIQVFNVRGQCISTLVDEAQREGGYSVSWNSRNAGGDPVPTGLYFVKMTAGKFTQTKKMMLVR